MTHVPLAQPLRSIHFMDRNPPTTSNTPPAPQTEKGKSRKWCTTDCTGPALQVCKRFQEKKGCIERREITQAAKTNVPTLGPHIVDLNSSSYTQEEAVPTREISLDAFKQDSSRSRR